MAAARHATAADWLAAEFAEALNWDEWNSVAGAVKACKTCGELSADDVGRLRDEARRAVGRIRRLRTERGLPPGGP